MKVLTKLDIYIMGKRVDEINEALDLCGNNDEDVVDNLELELNEIIDRLEHSKKLIENEVKPMRNLTTLQIACLEYFHKKEFQRIDMRGVLKPQQRIIVAMVKRKLLSKGVFPGKPYYLVTPRGVDVLRDLRPELFERPDAELFTCDFKERSGKSFVFGIGDLIEVDFKRRRRVA